MVYQNINTHSQHLTIVNAAVVVVKFWEVLVCGDPTMKFSLRLEQARTALMM